MTMHAPQKTRRSETVPYVVPPMATPTTTAKHEPWPLVYLEAVRAGSPTEARVESALAKYRRILSELPVQQREGDPGTLLIELSASEASIAEAEASFRD